MPSLFSPSAMTSNVLPTPYVASASQTRSGFNAYAAFSTTGLSGFNPWVTDNVASSTAPSYLEIDIGAAWVLSSYAVESSSTNGSMMVSAWQLQGSNDEVRWTTLDTQTGQTAWANFEIRTYTPSVTLAYRYFRVYITGNNGSGTNTLIAQLYLYGTSGTATPLPLDLAPHNMTANALPTPYVASASSVAGPGTYQPYFAFDGNITTTQWAGSGAGTDWLEIDLGASATLSGYAVRGGFQGLPLRAPKTWTLEGSSNGSTWTTLDTQTTQQNWQVAWTAPEVRAWTFSPGLAYRYFRLNITANNGDATFTAVFELYLFGVAGGAAGVLQPIMFVIT